MSPQSPRARHTRGANGRLWIAFGEVHAHELALNDCDGKGETGILKERQLKRVKSGKDSSYLAFTVERFASSRVDAKTITIGPSFDNGR